MVVACGSARRYECACMMKPARCPLTALPFRWHSLPENHLAVCPCKVEHAVGQTTITVFPARCRASSRVSPTPETVSMRADSSDSRVIPWPDRGNRVNHPAFVPFKWSRIADCPGVDEPVAPPDKLHPLGFMQDHFYRAFLHGHYGKRPGRIFVCKSEGGGCTG